MAFQVNGAEPASITAVDVPFMHSVELFVHLHLPLPVMLTIPAGCFVHLHVDSTRANTNLRGYLEQS